MSTKRQKQGEPLPTQELGTGFSVEETNALYDYVRKLSPRRLSVLTGLFLAAVAALLVVKLDDEIRGRRTETELRLARTVQDGAAVMNIDIMTGVAPGNRLGSDLPPGAMVTFYHLSESGGILATAGAADDISLDALTLSTLPLGTDGGLILDYEKRPLAVSWQGLDNGEALLAATFADDMFDRPPLWIGYAVLLGAITLLSAMLMRAFIRQNAAAHEAADALTGYIRVNEALKNGRCCPWHYNELTRKVLLSRSLLEPLGLSAQDRHFSLQELTSLIHPKDLRTAIAVFTGDKSGHDSGVARLRKSGGGWSSILIRTEPGRGRRNRSGIAFDITDDSGQLAGQSSNQEDGRTANFSTVASAAGGLLDPEPTLSDLSLDDPNTGTSLSIAPGPTVAAIVNALPDALVRWDTDGRLSVWNDRFANLFRIPEDALIAGMTPEAVVKSAAHAHETITRFFLPEIPSDAADDEHTPNTDNSSHTVTPAGRTFELPLSGDRWVQVSRRHASDGSILILAANITDLKRRARAYSKREQQLERTVADLEQSRRALSETSKGYAFEKQRAEEASRSKSEFLANMSHELRTPLNAINGFSEVMQSELYGPLGSEKYKEYIDDIHASGRHLLELIDDILDMSRIEAGKMHLDLARVELDRILKESIRLVGKRADDSGISFTASTSNAPPIWADARAAKQVALNLLANAIKFTPEGGAVTLTTDADLDCVSVLIIDNGPGIERADLEKLGSPFEVTHRHFARARHGSGLGLALSKSLMELQGGLLAIASQPTKGTIACATFPRRESARVRLPSFMRENAHILTEPQPKSARKPASVMATDRTNDTAPSTLTLPAQAAE